MIGLLDPRMWLAIALAMLAAYGSGRWQQWRADERSNAAALLQATQQARQREQQWQDDVGVLEDVHRTELDRVAAERDRAVAGLRNRPGRLPEAAQSACAGASPAQLSGPDAAVVVGIAAEADRLRADYAACKAWIETVRR